MIFLYIIILLIIHSIQPNIGIVDTHIFTSYSDLLSFLNSYNRSDWILYRYVFYLDLIGMYLYTSFLYKHTKSKVAVITYFSDLIESSFLFLFSFNIEFPIIIFIFALLKWLSVFYLITLLLKKLVKIK